MEVDPIAGHSEGALHDLTVREAEAALYEELARLPEKYRAPLVITCLEGLSRDETALRLGWSTNRVKHGLERGRDLLRSRLQRRGIAVGLTLLSSLFATPAGAVAPSLIESTARCATGATASPTIMALAEGVNRTMWMTNGKWLIMGGIGLALAAGGVAAALSRGHDTPTFPSQSKSPLVLVGAPVQDSAPKPSEEKKKPQEPWEIAAAFLKLALSGKTEEAVKLCDSQAALARQVDDIASSGLKVSRFRMMLMNDLRVAIVTERTKLAVKPGEELVEGSLVITLERARPDAKWLVRDMDFNDEARLRARIGRYLDGGFDFKQDPMRGQPDPMRAAKGPIPAVDIAAEFLKLAMADKVADALKLVVPGTVSEKKIGEIRNAGYARTKFVLVLINDARVEVVTEEKRPRKADEPEGHLVIMVVKSKDGEWRVKDLDVRDESELSPRTALYLAGRYDEKDTKK
jgi:hypothetical protein